MGLLKKNALNHGGQYQRRRPLRGALLPGFGPPISRLHKGPGETSGRDATIRMPPVCCDIFLFCFLFSLFYDLFFDIVHVGRLPGRDRDALHTSPKMASESTSAICTVNHRLESGCSVIRRHPFPSQRPMGAFPWSTFCGMRPGPSWQFLTRLVGCPYTLSLLH